MNKYGFTEREMYLMRKTFRAVSGCSDDDFTRWLETLPFGGQTNAQTLIQNADRLHPRVVDLPDAMRFRWLLEGNGYFMEEQMLCGPWGPDEEDKQNARYKIDAAMREEQQ